MPAAKNELTKEQILQYLREHKKELYEKYGVRKIGLFGSYARGNKSENSDIDLLLELEKPLGFAFVDLCEYLERILNHNVDVLTPPMLQHNPELWEDVQEDIVNV
ncbi:nucleotidyltransferase family protein [Flexistipes sp.]|uniref:nucleotidyltransferase family protein n=1 Tax=Flexistipes sp. TaxID=3088135 RepID=UPI002E1B60F1|nr:nucleotidyltransferase family protein [Flexistipes sp.]